MTMVGRTTRKFSIAVWVAMVCVSTGPVSLGSSAQAAGSGRVQIPKSSSYLIPLEGMIDRGLFESLKRRTQIAKDNGAKLIIFKIDTWGGRLDAAFEISDLISGLKKIKTVAYVPQKAISAGALIAMSCNEIVMGPGSTIGDCQPIIPTQEGYKEAGEKVESPLRARFRALAEANGYPVLLAEAMVTKALEVFRITDKKGQTRFISSKALKEMTETQKKEIEKKELVVAQDHLLTLTQDEAVEYGIAKRMVKNLDELKQYYKVVNCPSIETNWSEELVRFLDKIAPILLTIGLIALYLEIKAPGFGIPGIIALSCFAVLFLTKYLVGLANAPEIAIFVVGVVLLIVEIFFIPGFGFTGVAGLLCILLGLLLSFQDFWIPGGPNKVIEIETLWDNLFTIGVSFVASIVIFLLFVRFLPSTPYFRRLVLATTEQMEEGYTVASAEEKDMMGARGVAKSTLRPSGTADFDGKIVDVITEGDFLPPGTPVEVVDVQSNRIVVRRA